jgi:hypothetical protein
MFTVSGAGLYTNDNYDQLEIFSVYDEDMDNRKVKTGDLMKMTNCRHQLMEPGTKYAWTLRPKWSHGSLNVNKAVDIGKSFCRDCGNWLQLIHSLNGFNVLFYGGLEQGLIIRFQVAYTLKFRGFRNVQQYSGMKTLYTKRQQLEDNSMHNETKAGSEETFTDLRAHSIHLGEESEFWTNRILYTFTDIENMQKQSCRTQT